MPWRDYSIMEEKLAFINEYLSGSWSMKELCESFAISRVTGFKYLNRFRTFGITGLLESPRNPLSCPHKTPEAVEDAIVALRKEHPRYGAEKLSTILLANDPTLALPSIPTINNILTRKGLIIPRKRIRRIIPV
jgi:hypothetical protein